MTSNEIRYSETNLMLGGRDGILIGYDYADVQDVLGNYLSEEAEKILFEEKKDLPENFLEDFYANVGFETIEDALSEEELRSWIKGLK